MVLADIDATISLGNIIAGAAFITTAIGGIFAIRVNVASLQTSIEKTDQENERRFAEIDNQMRDFRAEMKKLAEVLIELTRQDGRMNTADERLLAQGKRVDSLAESLRELFRMINELQKKAA